MKRSPLYFALLLVYGLFILPAGCMTVRYDSGDIAADGGEPEWVELTWYMIGSGVQPDEDRVFERVNAILKERIRATVRPIMIDFGSYQDRLNTVIAMGEAFDIAWTSNWSFDYVGNAVKGTFLPLDELLQQYAPELFYSMPQFVWDAAKVNGRIYGIPNYQSVISREGFTIRKDLADRYGLDIKALRDLPDIEPFLQQVKAHEPDIIPFPLHKHGINGVYMRARQVEAAGPYAWVRLEEPYKVFNYLESPEFRAHLELMRRWFELGYINRNAATLNDLDALHMARRTAVIAWSSTQKPGDAAQVAAKFGFEVISVPIGPPAVSTNSIITTLSAVGAQSKHPEKAVQLLHLVNTDRTLYNLIAYGIEGKHYRAIGDNQIEIIAGGGYAPNAPWAVGNTFNGYILKGQEPDVLEETRRLNETAELSPLMGFVFNPAPVEKELTALKAIQEEYEPGLLTGTIAPEEKLDEYIAKMKQAGLDRVIAEVQRQIDAWRAAGGT